MSNLKRKILASVVEQTGEAVRGYWPEIVLLSAFILSGLALLFMAPV